MAVGVDEFEGSSGCVPAYLVLGGKSFLGRGRDTDLYC